MTSSSPRLRKVPEEVRTSLFSELPFWLTTQERCTRGSLMATMWSASAAAAHGSGNDGRVGARAGQRFVEWGG